MDDREAHEFYKDPEHLRIAGPGRKRTRPTKSTMAAVRFTPEAIEAVKAVAHEEGMTVSSWIRRLVRREVEKPEMVEMAVAGLDEPVRVPADALRQITAAVAPALFRYGYVDLRIGQPRAGAPRPEGLIPGSGRKGEPGALDSTLHSYGTHGHVRTFRCEHMSIGGVQSASCAICGPLPVVA